jgi:hypothetical protein
VESVGFGGTERDGSRGLTGRIDWPILLAGRVEAGRVEAGRVEAGRVEAGRVEAGRFLVAGARSNSPLARWCLLVWTVLLSGVSEA